LLKFIEDRHQKEGQEFFMHEDVNVFSQSLDEILLSKVFGNSAEVLEQYHKGSKDLKRFMLKNIKMSLFAEETFNCYAEKMKQPILLSKGEFYRLVTFCVVEEIPNEVSEKLDLLVKYLDYSG
jgi:hypothetical protein